MPLKMKYVKFNNLYTQTGVHDNIPVIFPEFIGHDEIARKIAAGSIPVSAGFVDVEFDPIHRRVLAVCYGHSISLGLKSDVKDSAVITRYLAGGG